MLATAHPYSDCDILCALPTGYPEELKFKLLERRAKARQSLGKLEEGITDIDTAIGALDKANLAQEKKEGKKSELQRFDMRWLDSIDGRFAGYGKSYPQH